MSGFKSITTLRRRTEERAFPELEMKAVILARGATHISART